MFAEGAPDSFVNKSELEKLLSVEAKIGQVQADQLGLKSKLEAAVSMARAIRELRAAITPGMMAAIMPLMNSPLGFRTDRPNKKNQNPYSEEQVKTVVIEALIRDLRLVGNEFNIIAERLYVTKEGFTRKIAEFPGLTNFTLTMGVPTASDDGAIVKCRATWLLHGSPDAIDREIAVHTDDYSTFDQVLGKADRKMRAAVYNKLAGSGFMALPDGEASQPSDARQTSTTSDGPKTRSLADAINSLPKTGGAAKVSNMEAGAEVGKEPASLGAAKPTPAAEGEAGNAPGRKADPPSEAPFDADAIARDMDNKPGSFAVGGKIRQTKHDPKNVPEPDFMT